MMRARMDQAHASVSMAPNGASMAPNGESALATRSGVVDNERRLHPRMLEFPAMKGFGLLLLSIALAVVCWGVYGPTLNEGRADMGGSSLRPFICVGLAYFLIAVLGPAIWIFLYGETGQWSMRGIVWSLAAGAAGAIGALGVILALAFRGSPVYVMPLVFGCAPVVNTFLTMYWSKSFRQISPVFIAGLILVIVGAVTVLVFLALGLRPAIVVLAMLTIGVLSLFPIHTPVAISGVYPTVHVSPMSRRLSS